MRAISTDVVRANPRLAPTRSSSDLGDPVELRNQSIAETPMIACMATTSTDLADDSNGTPCATSQIDGSTRLSTG
jgi:hypothetical protein